MPVWATMVESNVSRKVRHFNTAAAASPVSRVELLHGSGSASVLDATYFWVVLSTAVKGLSVWLGQKEKKQWPMTSTRSGAR